MSIRKVNNLRFNNAFTLVEVLVVIGVIAILVGILYPIFANVRERGRQTVCISNQRQTGLALHMYAEDNDNVLPPYLQITKHSWVMWPDVLVTYTKKADVFSCPSDPYPNTDTVSPCSFGYNFQLGGWSILNHIPILSKNIDAILKPASTVLLADSGIVTTLGIAPEKWPVANPNDCTIEDVSVFIARFHAHNRVTASAPSARHFGLCDVLFVDGHVKALKIKDFYTAPGVTAPGETVPGYSPCLDPAKGCS